MNFEKELKIMNIISLIIIYLCFFQVQNLVILLKISNRRKFSNAIFKNKKDELLYMCYKSRSLIYEKLRQLDELNLNTIQEKLNYLLIHESPDYKSKIVDKILLHDYSIKKLGIDICVPIINIYNESKEINLDELPDKFVLKCNHGCAMNILCNNKKKFNLDEAKYNLNQWMNINYGLITNEFQYLNINRKIFAEVYLKDNIEDYKVYCFHGIPKFIRLQKKIDGLDGKINNYYDLNWKLIDIESGIPGYYRRPEIKFKEPKNLQLMIKYAAKLSEDFVFVRVDFYDFNDTIFLGEMTFSPSNLNFKLKNRMQSIQLGNLIDLNKIKESLFN